MKTRSFVFALLAAVTLFAAPAMGDRSVTLRENVLIDGNVIHLGDLFANVGEHADTAVARAPSPGRRAVFDAEWLFRVARAYRLDWRPLARQDKAVVERASQTIGHTEIEDQILEELHAKGIGPEMEFELANRNFRIYIPIDAMPSVAVSDVIYNPRLSYVTATVSAPADDPAAQRFRVNGRVHRIVEVPVLSNRMSRDDVIGKRDVEWIQVRNDQITTDTVIDAANLIGMTPRRMLPANRPIRMSEIDKPTLVERRALVTLKYNIPRMTLTARGRALEDGSEGDTVRVVNLSSKLVVEGTVTGSGEVSVTPPDQLASN